MRSKRIIRKVGDGNKQKTQLILILNTSVKKNKVYSVRCSAGLFYFLEIHRLKINKV